MYKVMTSPPISPQTENRDARRSTPSGTTRGAANPERRAKRREAVAKAAGRIRKATGRDGNGLKDAARRVSDAVRERMGNRGSEERPGGRPVSRPVEAGGRERSEAPQKAAAMAKEKVDRVKSAAQDARQSAAAARG
jgi:hypothetical protein